MMDELTKKMLKLFESMLDEMCDSLGYDETIEYLLDRDFSIDEVVALGFDVGDVHRVFDNFIV